MAQKKSRVFAAMLVVLMCFSWQAELAAGQDARAISEFEVASIRPSGPQSVRGEDGGPGSKEPTLYRFSCATLQDLIVVAWKPEDYEFIIPPAPLDLPKFKEKYDTKFDLSVRVPEGATKEQFRSMLQNLLKERFQLKAHTETREVPGWVLHVAKTGLKLKHPGSPETEPIELRGPSARDQALEMPNLVSNRPTMITQHVNRDGYRFARVSVQDEPLSMFVRYLPKPDNLPVVDGTDRKEKYSFVLEYAEGTDTGALVDATSIFAALREQLGLELIKDNKLPFDFVVIESVNRQPTEN